MPDDRPVLIGIAPARAGEEGQPLSGYARASAGRRLADIMGISWKEYNRRFARVNVCPTHRAGGVPANLFRSYAENLAGSLLVGRTVIFMGSNVASCFGIRRSSYSYLTWYRPPHGRKFIVGWRVGMALPFLWAVVPHPSGRNRWYNEEDNRWAAHDFMRSVI